MSASRTARLAVALAAGVAALLAASALSAALGAQPISIRSALAGVEPDATILFSLRLPRVALAAIVGCALATAGAALQALLRNPLAEPFVLGVSGGAALGGSIVLVAAVALARVGAGGSDVAGAGPSVAAGAVAGAALSTFVVFGIGSTGGRIVPEEELLGGGGAPAGAAPSVAAGAVAGAALSTFVVFGLGRIGGRLVPEAALLVGIVFNSFVAGVITLMKMLVPAEQAGRLTYWLVGAVGDESGGTIALGAAVVGLAVAALVALSARVNLLTLADEEAASLGVDVPRTRATVFFAASAATGAAVALGGMVGFVGLIVPHVARRLVGPDHRLLLPASALFGAAFLVLADAAARLAFLPLGTEPPVGAITAFIGGPFFLWLLRRTEAREGASR